MRVDSWIADTKQKWESLHKHLSQVEKDQGFALVKIYAGMRTLPQNSLKAVWYGDIASKRGDTSAKEVERECKYKYGLPILRREPKYEFVFSKAVDVLDYERRLKVMDCFAVTSIMSVEELSEYLDMMQSDYPYLRGRKNV